MSASGKEGTPAKRLAAVRQDVRRTALTPTADGNWHWALQMPTRAREVFFVLLGVGGLVLKSQYSGPAEDVVHSFGGNVAASWAVYFLAKRVTARSTFPRASAAALAFLAVQLFEVLDGFGVMQNVYDRLDLVANTAGILFAMTLDVLVNRMSGGRSARLGGSNAES